MYRFVHLRFDGQVKTILFNGKEMQLHHCIGAALPVAHFGLSHLNGTVIWNCKMSSPMTPHFTEIREDNMFKILNEQLDR